MADVISFFVAGLAAPGGSKKAFVTRTGRAVIVDDAKGNRGWKQRVALAAADAFAGPPLDGPVAARFEFFVPRPRGHYGTGRNAARLKPSAPAYPTGKPDVLKLARSTEDALTGVLWRDDSANVRLQLSKDYGERPGVRITVRAMRWRTAGEMGRAS